jgi:HAD superfamily hydrolase (TIGR01459 family)
LSTQHLTLAGLDPAIRIVFCDIWGCVHDGVAAFPRAVALLAAWRAQQRTVVLITNAPRPVSHVERQLDVLGIGPDLYDAIVTSGDAAVVFARGLEESHPLGFIGSAADADALSAEGLALTDHLPQPHVVCIGPERPGIADVSAFEARLRLMAEAGSTLLCFNPDMAVLRGGVREICAGAIARRYGEMGGAVRYFGKPHAPIYDRAMAVASALLGRPVAIPEVVAVGDGVSTDLAGALNYGIPFVFVVNGVDAHDFAPDCAPAFFESVRLRYGLALGADPDFMFELA